MAADFPLSEEEFKLIYSKVPRLTVEILLQSDQGILLTKRTIEPCKGQWHLPGGTVYFGESLLDSVKRIANRELGINIKEASNIGIIEYPGHYKNGLDSPVGLVFKVESYVGEISLNDEADNMQWFKSAPPNLHSDQDVFLLENKFLASA
jgi:ADP-ribose pyrophosphatase YjhB (NUDIX family)